MRKTQDEIKQELIDSLRNARSSILELVLALSSTQRDVVFLGEWSVKDLLAHLAGWDFTNIQAVEQILEGTYPSFFQHYDKDWHTYNAYLVAQYKLEPFEALLAELDDSHRQLTAFLEGLPAGDILNAKVLRANGRSVTIHNLLKTEAADESRHALQLRDFFV